MSSLRITVDGEEFEVNESWDGDRQVFDYTWLTRHDGTYGFRAVGTDPANPGHEQRLRAFLAALDPETGYPPDN